MGYYYRIKRVRRFIIMLSHRSNYTIIASCIYALCKDWIKDPDSDMEYISAEAVFGMLEDEEQTTVLNKVQNFKDMLLEKYGQGSIESTPDTSFTDLVYHGSTDVFIKLKADKKNVEIAVSKRILDKLEVDSFEDLKHSNSSSFVKALFPNDRYTFYVTDGTWSSYNLYDTLREEHPVAVNDCVTLSDYTIKLDNGVITVNVSQKPRRITYHLKQSDN